MSISRVVCGLVALVALCMAAIPAQGAAVFEDGDFDTANLDPATPGNEPFVAGVHPFEQIWCTANHGQITLEETGGNPGKYLQYHYWGAIKVMFALDPAVLGNGGTVNFDWKGGNDNQRLDIVGLDADDEDNDEYIWYAGGTKEGVSVVSGSNSIAASADWEARSIDFDLTDTSFDAIVFAFEMSGPTDGQALDNIQVDIPAASVPGDTDNDGDVDLDDLFAVRNNFGMTTGATRAQGDVAPDPDGDGAVNLDDLFMVRNNFGTSTVPEPMTLSLLGISGLALLRRKR